VKEHVSASSPTSSSGPAVELRKPVTARVNVRDQNSREGPAGLKSAKAFLRDSEERLHAFLRTAVVGVITISERGIIESVNPDAEAIFGYHAVELIGQKLGRLMLPPYHEEHEACFANDAREGPARIIGIGREVVGKRKDDSVFPMELSVSEVILPEKRLFTGIVRDITERRHLELEVLEISDREQRCIGQGLHEGLGQQLAGIELMIRALERRLAGARAKETRNAAGSLGDIACHVREAIHQTRLLARGLNPAVLGCEDLPGALSQLAANVEQTFRVACRFECEPPVVVFNHAVATHLYRIAQQALANAIQHGKAEKVSIHLRSTGDRTFLIVKDNGVSLPATLPADQVRGLRIMQYRGGIIGGSLALQRDLDGGTSLVCALLTPGIARPPRP